MHSVSDLQFTGTQIFFGSNDFTKNPGEGKTFIAKLTLGELGTTTSPITETPVETNEESGLANNCKYEQQNESVCQKKNCLLGLYIKVFLTSYT